MGACRRIVAALLFVLWTAVGIPTPQNAPARGSQVTPIALSASASADLRQAQARGYGQPASEPGLGDDDEVWLPTWRARSTASFETGSTDPGVDAGWPPTRRRGPLAGKPRGPPSLT